ncbi:MAG: AAA family ATPase [Syntrophales bacterium LBB04]|nr:AAA family ATPase [Syntrophales bacterium LBB04]
MDYFSVLNLKREPFSNSPDPELFYPSRNQVECLQRLEMAIRLRRGLNVVLGEVGTGKTTLCRRLIQQISSAEGKEDIELHLVMDPSFSSPVEVLSFIAGAFGLNGPDQEKSDWRLKEAIKNYLFAKGVEEGKIVVLLIDEGQKLPDFCLEILREFLNYETNDSKLLQIVIFAQEEFRETINKLDNFADRINLCYSLAPLGYLETCRMVEFRISQTSESGAVMRLFTWPGLFALYLSTAGYPRSINMLCHHVVLALIIQNRLKAGWTIVRACGKRLSLKHRNPVGPKIVIMGAALFASLLLLVLSFNTTALKPALSQKSPSAPTSTATAISELLPSPQPYTAISMSNKGAPAVLGQLSLVNGTNLWHVFKDIAASSDPELFRKFVSANPQINDIQRVRVGEVLTVPAIPFPGDQVLNKVWIQVGRFKSLQTAYEQLRARSEGMPAVMLFPFWNPREGTVFALLLKHGFADTATALEGAKKLPPSMIRDMRLLDTWDNGTVFYHNVRDNS